LGGAITIGLPVPPEKGRRFMRRKNQPDLSRTGETTYPRGDSGEATRISQQTEKRRLGATPEKDRGGSR